jgi:hypothetical protein
MFNFLIFPPLPLFHCINSNEQKFIAIISEDSTVKDKDCDVYYISVVELYSECNLLCTAFVDMHKHNFVCLSVSKKEHDGIIHALTQFIPCAVNLI